MSWPPDVPDINLAKPKELAYLEKLEPQVRNAMTKQEVSDHIETIAQRFAENYKQKKGSDYTGCLETVSLALSLSGGAIGGKVGQTLMGTSSVAAKAACRIVFDVPIQEN